MPYNNFYNPYGLGMNNFQSQQPSGLTQVVGLEGAKAYQTPPNSTVPLFDSDNAVFYVKTTDNMGNSSVRVFDFEERPPESTNYVTQRDFNVLNDKINDILEVLNGKSVVSEASSDADQSNDREVQPASPARRRKSASSI